MAQFKNFIAGQPLVESSVDLPMIDVTLNPTRDDVDDLIDKIMPFIVSASYYGLTVDKNKHEQRWGTNTGEEDHYAFDFTEDALFDEVDTYKTLVASRLNDMSIRLTKEYIKMMASKFPVPLNSK